MHDELTHTQQCVVDLLIRYPHGERPPHAEVVVKGKAGDWHKFISTGGSMSSGTVRDMDFIDELDRQDAQNGHAGIVFPVDSGSSRVPILEEEA